MLLDGIQLLGSSIASNFSVESGNTLPTTNTSTGELYYKIGVGLHVYDGAQWVLVAAGATVDSAHIIAALGYTPAALDSSSFILASQLPAIAITDTFVVASQAAMLALTAQTGDVAVRTDTSTSYILKGSSPATLSNWQQLLVPTQGVQTVNGLTGSVTLTTANISEGSNLYYTDARARSALSVTGSGGSYNSSTGVITLTGGSSTVLSGTGTTTHSISTTGLFAGTSGVGTPEVLFIVSGGAADQKAARLFIDNSGNFVATFQPDSLSSEVAWLKATRSGTAATNIAFTSAAINLAVGSGGLQLNGSAGTAGQVLTSNGAAAPTWTTVSTGGGSGTVTSVALSSTDLTVSGSPITTTGTLVANLSTVNSNVGSFGSASTVPVLTVDAKGRITAVSSVAINTSASTSLNAIAAASYTSTVTSLSAGINATTSAPGIIWVNSAAPANQKISWLFQDSSGNLNWNFLPDSNANAGTNWFQVTRSSQTASNITLSGTAITLTGAVTGTSFTGIGTGLTALNATNLTSGTVGTARLGTGTASATTYLRGDGTWTTPNGFFTNAQTTSVTTSGVGLGSSSGQNVLTFIASTAATDTKMSRIYTTTTGVFFDFVDDAFTSGIAWLQVNKSARTATSITLTTTALNLAVGTGGLQLNGAPGTAGQVLTSSGASSAPTWAAPGAASITGGVANQIPYQTAASTTGFSGTLSSAGPSLVASDAAGNYAGGALTLAAGAGTSLGTVVNLLTLANNRNGASGTAGDGVGISFMYAGAANNSYERASIRMVLESSNSGAVTFNTGIGNLGAGLYGTGSQAERFRITGTGALAIAGAANYGTSGQVLTSQGNAAPIWSTPAASSAAAGTLTGTTLASNVVTSSLTSVGTLSSLAVTNGVTASGVAANGVMPTVSGNSVTIGLTVGSTLPGIQFQLPNAAAGLKTYINWSDASGNLNFAFLPDSGANMGTNWMYVTRSGQTATAITLSGTTINLAAGTGGLQLNGSAGTAGQVLTSNGNAAAPTWGTNSVSALNGTGLTGETSTTGTYVGRDAAPVPQIVSYVATATATNRASRTYVNATGSIKWDLLSDTFATQTNFFQVDRSGSTPTAITLTATAISTVGRLDIKSSTEGQAALTFAATEVIDCSLGNIFTVTLTGNITSFTLSNIPATGKAYSMTLFLTQDATGSRLVTWTGFTGIKWPNGVAPTLTTTANKTDIITLTTFNGGTTWFGFTGGLNY